MPAPRPVRAQTSAATPVAVAASSRRARAGRSGLVALICGAALVLAPACGRTTGDEGSVAEGPSDATSEVVAAEPALPTPDNLVASRDGRLGVKLPRDLVVQPFGATLMATSADGSLRLHVEARDGELLATLGPLKDELIALGWEVEAEKHFQAAIHLQLGMGVGRHRVARHLWLVERRSGAERVSVLCEGHGRGGGTTRLGAQLRAICQTVEVRPP